MSLNRTFLIYPLGYKFIWFRLTFLYTWFFKFQSYLLQTLFDYLYLHCSEFYFRLQCNWAIGLSIFEVIFKNKKLFNCNRENTS